MTVELWSLLLMYQKMYELSAVVAEWNNLIKQRNDMEMLLIGLLIGIVIGFFWEYGVPLKDL
jgi:hypothetical protein